MSSSEIIPTCRVEDTRDSSSLYCASVMLGLKGKPWTLRPHLILVLTTYWPSGSRSPNWLGSPKSQAGWTSVLRKPP